MEVKDWIKTIVGVILLLEVGSCIADEAGCGCGTCGACGGDGCEACDDGGDDYYSSSDDYYYDDDDGCGGCGDDDDYYSSSNNYDDDDGCGGCGDDDDYYYSSSNSWNALPPPAINNTGTVQYMLSDDGTYYIASATGRLQYKVEIKETYDGLPVKEIAEYGFKDCYETTTVILPDSINKIGKYAFQGCTSLATINIPARVLEIGKNAFQFCDGLNDVSFGATTDWSQDGATVDSTEFGSVESIVSLLKSGKPLTRNHTHTFSADWSYGTTAHWKECSCGETSEEAVHILDANNICTVCGMEKASEGLYYTMSNDSTYAIVGGIDSATDKEIYIASVYNGVPVKAIAANAFRYSSLTKVHIPDSVTTIGEYAFYGCGSLQEVYFSTALETIGISAFQDCYGIQEIVIPNTVTSIGASAFYNCNGMKTLTLSENLVQIPTSAFADCSKLVSVTIPAKVTTIGENAFSSCSTLSSVVLPESLQSICGAAFQECFSLPGIAIPKRVTYIGTYAFAGCGNLNFATFGETEGWLVGGLDVSSEITNSTTAAICLRSTYESYTWTKVEHLDYTLSTDGTYYIVTGVGTVTAADISIPSTYENLPVREIGAGAFKNCTGLYSIALSSDIRSIGDEAFYGCTGLSNLTFSNENLKKIGDSAFYGCTNLQTATLSGGIEEIGDYAFTNCSSLYQVSLGAEVKRIGVNAFHFCESLNAAYINDTSDWFAGSGLAIVSTELSNSSTAAYYLREYYSDYSWEKINSLAYVLSNDGTYYIVTGIGSIEAVDVIVPMTYNNLPIQEIASGAFRDCTQIRLIALPSSIATIGAEAFYNCTNLQTIEISADLQTIGDYAFAECSSLTEISLGANVQSIGAYAFAGCTSLSTVYLENTENWTAGDMAIDSTELADSALAASYFKDYYVDVAWTKTVV